MSNAMPGTTTFWTSGMAMLKMPTQPGPDPLLPIWTIMLSPIIGQSLKSSKPATKTVNVWSSDSSVELRESFFLSECRY